MAATERDDVMPRIEIVKLPPISLGLPAAAEYLGTTVTTLKDAIHQGELPAVKLGTRGRAWSILVDDLDAWRKAQRRRWDE